MSLTLAFLDRWSNLLFQSFDISILLLPDLRAQELGQEIDITFEDVADTIKVVKTILTL